MNSIKFNPMPKKKARLFFSVAEESLTNFYALTHAVDLVNKYDGRYDISLAFENPSLVTLAKEVGWLGFNPELLSNVGVTRVISLSPSPERVASWEEKDREDEFDYRVEKYPSIDPEKLKVPEIKYNEYISILRDAMDIFDITLSHPLQILLEARNVRYIDSKKLRNAAWSLLDEHRMKSGAFLIGEVGFAKWNGSEPIESWGRVIPLPTPQDLLSNEESLLKYVGAFNSFQCAGIGLVSTDYVPLGVSSYRQGTPVIWDLRPSFGSTGEDLNKRLLSSLLIPDNKNVLAPNMDPTSVEESAITRELAYAFSAYYDILKKVISQGKRKSNLERPTTPNDFEWSLA